MLFSTGLHRYIDRLIGVLPLYKDSIHNWDVKVPGASIEVVTP